MEQAENPKKSRQILIKFYVMAYCFKVTVKSSGHFLPKGYTFQVIHSQKTLDNAAVNNAAAAEYQKLNGGKKPCSAMYLSSVDVVSL